MIRSRALVDFSRASASHVDGLLTIRVVNPHATGVNVPVSATPLGLPAPADANENADDADKIDGDKVTLIQRAVPGVSAADFTVEIDRKNTLTARADASTRFGRRRYSFSVALPKNVDMATVAAEVVNGVLTVCAAKPSLAAKSDPPRARARRARAAGTASGRAAAAAARRHRR